MSNVTVIEQDSVWRRAAAALHVGKWERDDRDRLRRGSWMQTYSGGKVWPLDPRADEIVFDDVCVGLAREWRYGNHVVHDYHVSTHSVLVSMYCERLATERGWLPGEVHEVACEGLLHDSPEAYLGDVPRPIKKQRVMRGYSRIESRWWRAICERFGLTPSRRSTELVKEVDTRILIDEIGALMRDPGMWWRAGRYAGVVGLGATIPELTWQQSADLFSRRFGELFPEEVWRANVAAALEQEGVN